MVDAGKSKANTVGDWLSRLEDARKSDGMDGYNAICDDVRKRYRYENTEKVKTRQYQMLWSNVQTMQSAIYAKPPHAVVSRRFKDQDPIARSATEVMERAVNFSFDASDFDTEFKMVRDDFLLYGRGVARVYYEPEYETEDDLNDDISDAEDISKGRGLGSRAPDDGLSGNEGVSGYSGQARSSSERDSGGTRPDAGKPYGSTEPGYGDVGRGDKDQREPKIKFENVRIRFVQRSDFRHQAARTWSEVPWVAFRAFMTRAEIGKRFSEKIAKELAFDASTSGGDGASREGESRPDTAVPKAAVWEIWDKAKNRVLWISPEWPDVLESGAPYLDLDGFYPCPRPAFGTLTPDSLIPVPDYVFYKDQAAEINQLTARIASVSDALKFVGFYPAGPQGEGSPEIERAFTPGFENKMVSVMAYDSFLTSGGGKGPPIVFLPVEQAITILEGCVKLRQQLVEDVYQIIGLSDIMRGATDPQETEGAQQLKAQYGGTRIRDRQNEIARFCRDIARLAGQIIAQYCSPQTIMKMTNVTLPTKAEQMMQQLQQQLQTMQQQPQLGQPNGNGAMPQQPQQAPPQPPQPTQEDVFGLLKDSLLRRFKIDIETDSTVAGDESQEKQDRTQFIESVTKFMEAWGPMVMQKPEMAPLAGNLLMFGVRAFRIGRELEETIEETIDKLSMPQPQKVPDPKVQAEQVKAQAAGVKAQTEIQKSQIDAQTAQQSAQSKQQEIQMKMWATIEELKAKIQMMQQEHAHKQGEAQMEHGANMDKMALQHQQIEGQKQAAANQAKWPTNPGKDQGF